MPDELTTYTIRKAQLKANYDAALNAINREEYDKSKSLDQDIAAAKIRFEATMAATLQAYDVKIAKATGKAKTDLEALKTLAQEQFKKQQTDLQLTWAQATKDLKESFNRKKTDFKEKYDADLIALSKLELEYNKRKKEDEERKRLEEERKKKAAPPEVIITRIEYPRWWKRLVTQTIDLTAPGSQVVVPGSPNNRTFISSITLLVTGETVITLNFGVYPPSGPMHFGGENQPMGITIDMSNAPAPCGSGNFTISATDPTLVAPSVGGFVVYLQEPD